MSTTTPRLSPCEACEPMPITSTVSPGVYSPTIATTFDVPMSRPTIRDFSPLTFMSMVVRSDSVQGSRTLLRRWRNRRRIVRPQDREAVAVAQVGALEPACVAGRNATEHGQETLQVFVDMLVAEQDL